MMNICLPVYLGNPRLDENPYVYTLTESIQRQHNQVKFDYNLKSFWATQLSFDVVHIMWPEFLLSDKLHDLDDLKKQFEYIKKCNKYIVCTCHNLQPHKVSDTIGKEAYDIAYRKADIIIHLADYSKDLLEKKYPFAKHVIIPHHVYDELYPSIPNRNDALRALGLPDRQYAICLGVFRNQREKELFLSVANCMRKHKIYCIAPSFLDIPKWKIDKRWVKQRLKWLYLKFKYPNIITGAGYIPDNLIPCYYAISDISIIQRLCILNSGNVPLGMYFGKVILGPNAGNVNVILRNSNNPIFDVDDFDTIEGACENALIAVQKNKGIDNRNYSKQFWATAKIAEDLYQLYRSLVEKK